MIFSFRFFVVALWVVWSLINVPFAFAAGDLKLDLAFEKADYRDVNTLRALLKQFETFSGASLQSATTEELLIATDIASCLWNITDSVDEQERLAKAGSQWAKEIYRRDPNMPAAVYFVGLNLLMYAQSKGVLDTLFSLRDVKSHFEAAYAKEPTFLHSSPAIGLGALYLFAPGFPVAFGDLDKAERYLQEGARTSPKNTTALVLLGAVYAKKGDKAKSLAAFQKVRTVPAWNNPATVWDKDMDFWWHVDQIRAIRALRAYAAGESPKTVFNLVDTAVRDIKEPYLPKALSLEKARGPANN